MPDAASMIAYLRYSPRPMEKVLHDPLGDTMANSFRTQRGLITNHLDVSGCSLPVTWIEDPLVSARLLKLAERPGGQQVLQLIQQGCRHIIVAAIDRLFRDVVDGLETLEQWSQIGVTLHSCDGFSLNTSTAYGYLMACNVLSVAAFEPRRVAERTKETFAAMRKEGRATNGTPQFGYRHEISGYRLVRGKRKPIYRHVPDQHEQAVCRRIRELFAGGMGYRDIGRLLENEGVCCRQKARWHPQTIKRIVENGDAAR